MSIGQYKTNLLELLSLRFTPYNFKLIKRKAEFERKTPSGWDKFHLIFLERGAGWEINIGMLIRNDVVEDIYHKASFFETKYQKSIPTIGISIENFMRDEKNYRYHLNSEKDIAFCADNIEKIFTKIALSFFDQYNTIEKMDMAVNVKVGKSIFSGPKYEGNLGVILAKLTNNPDYDYFVEKYHQYYKNFCNGFYLPEFEGLIEILT